MAIKKVLSLDGGGIRGIIPAMILEQIEKNTGKPIAETFDLIAGTSTGGILALALSRRGTLGSSPLYPASQLVEMYRNDGPKIFSRSFWRGISTAGGLAEEKYSADGLESVLNNYLAATKLGEAVTKVLISSYEIEKREPFFFKSWKDSYKEFLMKEVARATSAAPTFFEPADVHGPLGQLYCIDGGVFINSPSVAAYAEAKSLWPDDEIRLLSIGTGEFKRPIPFEDAKDWGMARWLLPVMSCMFDGMACATDYQMRTMLGDNYLRIQGELEHCNDDMDDASSGNLRNLMALGNELILKCQDQLKNW